MASTGSGAGETAEVHHHRWAEKALEKAYALEYAAPLAKMVESASAASESHASPRQEQKS